jgi:hypothetical protein
MFCASSRLAKPSVSPVSTRTSQTAGIYDIVGELLCGERYRCDTADAHASGMHGSGRPADLNRAQLHTDASLEPVFKLELGP